jgi:hypothetical protein
VLRFVTTTRNENGAVYFQTSSNELRVVFLLKERAPVHENLRDTLPTLHCS